ncbi:MAG: tetratricopeptide repeat protein [Deltaproteobacteria bacterium]|nr:tetratricopeptide repeat protein [Deltaproteobacteria bacterium]
MIEKKKEDILKNQDSAEQFIFCKAACGRFEKDKKKQKIICSKALKETFINIPVGDDIIKYFLSDFNSEKFCAVAVKANYDDTKDDDYQCVETAKIIDKISEEKNGVWGLIEPAVFGIIFENKKEQQIEYNVNLVKESLEKTANKKVFAGAASFPTSDYNKEDIIKNALKALDHAILTDKRTALFNSVTLNISGDKYYEQNNIKKAKEEFKAALKLVPSDLNILNSLGVCYAIRNDYLKAHQLFKKITEKSLNHQMAAYNIGMANLMLNKKEDALKHFLILYNQNEDYLFESGFQIAKIYIEDKNFKKAKPYIDTIIRLKPEKSVCHRLAGNYYAGLEDIDNAINSYKKAVKYNPYDAASLSALGYLFDKKGENIEIAISFCKESAVNFPENGLYRYRLGKLYFKNKMLNKAFDEFIAASNAGYDSSEYINIIKKELNITPIKITA